MSSRVSISVNCNLLKTAIFLLSEDGAHKNWWYRRFNFVQPMMLSEKIVVYGFNEKEISLISMQGLVIDVVGELLEISHEIILENKKLTLILRKKLSDEDRRHWEGRAEWLSERLNLIMDGDNNARRGSTFLVGPFQILTVLSLGLFLASMTGLPSTFNPFRLFIYSIETSAVLFFMSIFIAFNFYLSKNILGGSVAKNIAIHIVLTSIFSCSSTVIFCNTWLGARIASQISILAKGHIIKVTARRGTFCYFSPSSGSPKILAAKDENQLKTPCSDELRAGDSNPYTYLLMVNPGLLGSAFLQSINIAENPMASGPSCLGHGRLTQCPRRD